MSDAYDAIVVGSGPNGLAAAITLARAGCSVLVYEANATIGGGARSAELTLPGFLHDVCSAVHPLAAGSPFFRTLPLERLGLQWIEPEVPLAHPLDNGSAACLYRDIDVTAEQLFDDSAHTRLMKAARAESVDGVPCSQCCMDPQIQLTPRAFIRRLCPESSNNCSAVNVDISVETAAEPLSSGCASGTSGSIHCRPKRSRGSVLKNGEPAASG